MTTTAVAENIKPAVDTTIAAVDSSASARDEKPLLPIKLMIKRGATGTVKWFSFKSGYGFITVDDYADDHGETDVFVHSSSILTFRNVNCVLHEGEKVEFDVVKSTKGVEAVAVTGEGGIKAGTARFQRSGGSNIRRRNSVDSELRNLRIKDEEDKADDSKANDNKADNNKANDNKADNTLPAKPKPKPKRKNNRTRKASTRGKVSATTSGVTATTSGVVEEEQ